MTDAATMVQQHATAIINALVETLDSPDGRARVEAAELLLNWGWGLPDRKGRRSPEPASTGKLSATKLQRAIDLLMPHLESEPKDPNPTRPGPTKNTPLAEPELTPCPAAVAAEPLPPIPPDSVINPMSRERSPSPLAAPPGTDFPRRDADPMSRPLLPPSHRDDPFRRPLPMPPPVEPPWPHALHSWPAHVRKRWR